MNILNEIYELENKYKGIKNIPNDKLEFSRKWYKDSIKNEGEFRYCFLSNNGKLICEANTVKRLVEDANKHNYKINKNIIYQHLKYDNGKLKNGYITKEKNE